MPTHQPCGRSFAFVLGCAAAISLLASPRARAQTQNYGRTCGLQLDASLQLGEVQRVLELRSSGAAPASICVLAFGTQRANGTLPGSCPIHLLPLTVVPYVADLQGKATQRLSIPASMGLGLTTFQAAELDARTMFLRTSNGVELRATPAVRTLSEDFTTQVYVDPDLDGAIWANGALRAAELGGSGVLGEFRATDGRDLNRKDAQGRAIYEFDIDRIAVPAEQTLDGKARVVTNGVLEYASFVVGVNEHVRFVGSKPVQLRVAGAVRIDGALDMYLGEHTTTRAQPGSLGGAAGGAGAIANGQGVVSSAADGGVVVLPRGHPRAGAAVGTGGLASPCFPVSGLDRDIVWMQIQSFKIFVRQMAAGGGGGEFFNVGANWSATGGAVVRTPSANYPILTAYQNSEFPPATSPGRFFPALPIISGRSSLETFLIGGSGGGGAGAHAAFSPAPSAIKWSAGGGGAAGGGALAIACGGAYAANGVVSARGGAGQNFSDNNSAPPAHCPGGAGSGGSILVQTARSAKGSFDVRGGDAGSLRETSPLTEVGCDGGRGGAGYLRVESPSLPKLADLAGSTPPATTDNIATLRAVDHSEVSGAGSKWYRLTNNKRAELWSYTIDALVDNVAVTYSDAVGSTRRAVEGEAVVASFQRGTVDSSGRLLADRTDWSLGSARALNAVAGDGNALRFFLRLDKKFTATGAVRILRVQVKYD